MMKQRFDVNSWINRIIYVLLALCAICLVTPSQVLAQDIDFRGYLKELGGINFSNDLGTVRFDNIIHNRVESRWELRDGLEVRADMRNRIISGYTVREFPGYDQLLSADPGYADLSWIPFQRGNTLLHSNIDRLQVSYYTGNWEFHAGRQRLNWGKTMVWNPNDLFNAYAFLDFDYEERPGTDAIAIQYNWDYASGVQLGYRIGGTLDESVIAGMYRGNVGSYDIQIIGGSYLTDWVAGGAFAGYLGDAGFKGEFSYFHPREGLFDRRGHATFTIGADYMFPNALYITSEFLINGGFNDQNGGILQLTQPPTADNLFPSHTGVLLQGSFAISPLLQASAGVISSVTERLFILIPQLSYSVSENIDLLLLMQSFQGNTLSGVTETPNSLFIRLKWSY
jgi:hypothetical protein